MLTATQLKGSFQNAIEITAKNLQSVIDRVTPMDMRREIEEAIESGSEINVFYASHCYDGKPDAFQFLLFPNAERGAFCAGGDSDWVDATTLDDIELAFSEDCN